MSTLEDSIAKQSESQILAAPKIKPSSAADTGSVTFSLFNSTPSATVYAYVTGIASGNNYTTYLLGSDGATPYYPDNPAADGSPLAQDVAIPLGDVGTSTDITIPYTDGGRLWFSIDEKLTFVLNPSDTGAQIVEPSVTNTGDPNYSLTWDFCEFSFSAAQIYVNITYVDFVALPIALTLTNTSGTVTEISGIPADGLDTIGSKLVEQNSSDGAGWDQLLVKKDDGSNLRVLNPTAAINFHPELFQDYWTAYIDEAWTKYASEPLTINTQFTWGTVTGNTNNDRTAISFSGVGEFTKPTAADIFSQNTGAFAAQATNTDELLNIGARLSTAINRSTLITNPNQPDDETVESYYTNAVTNHFARIVHETNLDGKGYCFPYDDVNNGSEDQSGFLSDPAPQNLLVTVGGGNAAAKLRARLAAAESKKRRVRRSVVTWRDDVKQQPAGLSMDRDLERGVHPKLMNELAFEDPPKYSLPPVWERVFGKHLERLRSSQFYSRARPVFELINRFFIAFLSLSLRAILSRVAIIAFVLIFYFLGMEPRGTDIEAQRRILESAGLINNATLTAQAP